jgi:exopolysaccharide transport family protein
MMDGSVTDGAAPQLGLDEPIIDLRKLLAIFRRRLRLFIATVVLILTPVILYTYQATPRYTATASVMLDVRKENVVNVGTVLSSLPADSAVVDTEVEVLKSRTLAGRVVDTLKLTQDPEFNSSLREESGLQRTLHSIIPGGGAKPKAVDPVRLRDRMVDQLLGRLEVQRSGLTYLINISFESTDPVKAARIANEFANLYLVEQLNAKFEATRQANSWLNDRLGELRGQVQETEAAVQQYRIANNLMSAEGTTLTEQEISNLNSQLASARANQAEAEARLSAARAQLAAGSTGGDVGAALDSPVVGQLRQQRALKGGQVADLQGRYGDRHPDLLKARRELAEIDDAIQKEIGRVLSNLEAQVRVARERTASLEGSVGRSKGVLAGNSRASVRLGELQRNADAVRTLYESFLTRFKQTSTQEGVDQSDARVLSQAKVPNSASYPRKSLNLFIGLVLALCGATAMSILAEMMNSGLLTAEDVERQLDIPSIASIPSLASTLDQGKGRGARLSPIDYVVDQPLSGFTESFRTLRAALLFSRLGNKVQIVAITSSLPGEGKTTTSLCLARTAALAGTRVLLIDCDLRQQALSTGLRTEPEIGLLEVLNGTVSFREAVVADSKSNAQILPLSKSAYTPKDVFNAPTMKQLLTELRNAYDLIILDTAPVLPIADTRVLAPLADAVVVLARWRKTPRKAIGQTLSMLNFVGAHIAGVALTQVDLQALSRYGYGDSAYYYKSYRKYYGG